VSRGRGRGVRRHSRRRGRFSGPDGRLNSRGICRKRLNDFRSRSDDPTTDHDRQRQDDDQRQPF